MAFIMFCIMIVLLDDVKFNKNTFQDVYGAFYLLFGVCGHQGETHQGVLRSTSGWNNGVDKHATLVSLCCYDEGLFYIVNI